MIAKFAATASDPTAGAVSATLAHVARKSVEHFLKDPSFQKAHEDMKKQLRQSHQRVLVTIDDMDRLEAEEIRTIMRMVKSVGQLPNVVYLLFYDREIVWKALDGTNGKQGPSFAEKIVQQELELPKPRPGHLLKMLDEEASFLVEEIEPSLHWERIVRDGVRRWIRTPRDAMRLGNAIKFSWSALEHEIDPQDLLAMEGLRLFDSEAFNWIRENRSLIFREDRFLLAEDATLKAVVGQLKESVPERKRSEVVELVATLFPDLASLLFGVQKAFTARDLVDIARRRGVGSEAGYDSYFGLYPSDDAVSLSELNKLVSEAEAHEIERSLQKHLHKNDSSGESMIISLLDELCARYKGQQAAEPRREMLDALFAAGEEIISHDVATGTMFEIRPRQQFWALTGLLLDSWGIAEAGTHLIETFRKTRSPAILADAFVSRAHELQVFESTSEQGSPRISESDFKELGEILLSKIRNAEADGTLSSAVFYFDILRSWSYLCGPDEARHWMEEGIGRDKAFMVKVCIGLVSYSDGASERSYSMREAPPEDLYDLNFLDDMAIKHLERNDLTEDEQSLIAAVAEGTAKMLGDIRSDRSA